MSLPLCLSFALLAGTQALHVPEAARDLSQSRIKKQWSALWEKRDKEIELRFDDESCPYQGSYWYGADQVVLSADHAHWAGRLEMSMTDLLEGKKIYFHSVSPQAPAESQTEDRFARAFSGDSFLEKKRAKPRLWPWLVGGLVAGGSLYLGYRIYQETRKDKEAPESKRKGPKKIGFQFVQVPF
jgi:hypothetical protein